MVWTHAGEAGKRVLQRAEAKMRAGREGAVGAPPSQAAEKGMSDDGLPLEANSPSPTRKGEGDPARTETSTGRPRVRRRNGTAPSLALGRPVLVWSDGHSTLANSPKSRSAAAT